MQVYLCGASLIAPKVVLTSGHCVNDTENLQDILTVRCGEWDTQNEDEMYPFQELKVDRIQVCAGREYMEITSFSVAVATNRL